MSFWLVGWTIQALARSHFIVGIATWLAGTAMVTGMAWWSLVTERKQIRLALDKLAQEFGWPPFWL